MDGGQEKFWRLQKWLTLQESLLRVVLLLGTYPTSPFG
jgi:hypothetical protein